MLHLASNVRGRLNFTTKKLKKINKTWVSIFQELR